MSVKQNIYVCNVGSDDEVPILGLPSLDPTGKSEADQINTDESGVPILEVPRMDFDKE